MDILRSEMLAQQNRQQDMIDAAVSRITKSFEEKIAKLIEERDAALLSAKSWRGKNFGRESERNAGKGKDDYNNVAGEKNRESEKADYVDAETQKMKDSKKRAGEEKSIMDAEKLVKKLKCRYPGADVIVERVDYSKASQYMSDDHVVVYKLDEYFTLSEGEYFRTSRNGEIEKSWYRIIIRYPESYEEHLYGAAHVRSNDNDEYKTTDIFEAGRPVPGCMFSVGMLVHILCEKYQYHTPIEQIVEKLHHQGLKIPKSVIGEHLHRAIECLFDKLEAFWRMEVRCSWILMQYETRLLVGCTGSETNEHN